MYIYICIFLPVSILPACVIHSYLVRLPIHKQDASVLWFLTRTVCTPGRVWSSLDGSPGFHNNYHLGCLSVCVSLFLNFQCPSVWKYDTQSPTTDYYPSWTFGLLVIMLDPPWFSLTLPASTFCFTFYRSCMSLCFCPSTRLPGHWYHCSSTSHASPSYHTYQLS